MTLHRIVRYAVLGAFAGTGTAVLADHAADPYVSAEGDYYDRYVVVAPRLTRPAEEHFLIEDVKDALARDPAVKPQKIDVDYERGAVTLSGQVRSDAQAERAARTARSAAGSVDVHNYLRPGFMN
jgi:hypothetical protein